MKYVPKVCAFAGALMIVISLILRLPDGLQFSTRGVMEFTQTILLLGICFSLLNLSERKGS